MKQVREYYKKKNAQIQIKERELIPDFTKISSQ